MGTGDSGEGMLGTGSLKEVLEGGREIISGTTLFPLSPVCERE